MSLTKNDLGQISNLILDSLNSVVMPRFDAIEETLDEHTKILGDHSRILDEHTRILHEHTKILGDHSRTLREHDSKLHSLVVSVGSIERRLDSMDGRLQALENDIKEIYEMLGQQNSADLIRPSFRSLPNEKKLLILNQELLPAAKQMGVTLPR